MADAAAQIQGKDEIRQRLHQRLQLLVLALQRHEGHRLDIQDAADPPNFRHQLLQMLKTQIGEMQIDEATGLVELDAPQIDGMLLQPHQQLTGQPQPILTTDL